MPEGTGDPELPDDRSVVCEFDNTWYSYGGGEPAVESVSFQVRRGDFAAILGPNGSGKTTLLRLALGLLKPSRGSVELFGESSSRFRDWSRVGYVPQRVEGLGTRFPATVEEIVEQGLYRGFDPLAIFRRHGQKKVLDALEVAGISHLRQRAIESLSVGQRQRALIARAIVGDPELLFLDEPVSGVDAVGRDRFHELISSLNKEHNMTVFLISHDIGAVMQGATVCACINRTVVFHGAPHSLTGEHLSELYGFPVDVLLHDALHEHR
ncbi:MAG: metal ABC transporter ATP-binding protein [Chloroflexi bacterium]|nr:metal ABC transporter ATP-binding protein [Chloroflexota bacterium]MBT4515371.1 metal ABC transporter ATP-binding protein [Chloroflexota bacterium]MBT6683073.1 metal ABC transporter ATP-binding protein [Chloroflexota bacterium]